MMLHAGHPATFRPSLISLVLAFWAAFLPSGAVGEGRATEEARKKPPTHKSLLESTYLGNAAEMPGSDEPVEVLQRFLDQGHHGQDLNRTPAREIAIWRKAVKSHAGSRYAHVGLGRAYRVRWEQSKRPADLKQAIAAYLRASEIALDQGRILYTRELSELLVQGRSVAQLDDTFAPLLAAGPNLRAREYYLALVDYADGLAELGDDRGWDHFEQALSLPLERNIEALNRHARGLLKRNLNREALDLLEGRLTREERIRHRLPAFLRREAMGLLKLDTSSADEEIEEIRNRLSGTPGTGASTDAFVRNANGTLVSIAEPFAHSNTSDDCRSTTYAQQTQCDSTGTCYYPFIINLAEILYNEARSETWGAIDMVGWTVRNRALQGLSCDSYPGGVNSTSCRSNLPCGHPSYCDLSRWYCCAEHGGTTTVGATQYQFNDAHVTMANLESSGMLTEASYVINGTVPEPSTGFVPSGVSGCTFGCSGYCTTGFNAYAASPRGPMEFRGYNYCAAASSCKWYSKNVCGNNSTPSSCSTGGNSGDNHFWNRN